VKLTLPENESPLLRLGGLLSAEMSKIDGDCSIGQTVDMKKVIVDRYPKPVRFQFSLRTMFVAIIVLSLLLGLVVVPVARQVTLRKESDRLLQQAISKVDALAAKRPSGVPKAQWLQAVEWTSYVVAEIFDSSDYDHRNLDVLSELCEGLDERTAEEVDLTTLQFVWERLEEVEPDGEDRVFRLRDVRLLTAGPITDDRLPELWAMDKCVWLNLSGTEVTDAGLRHLADLDRLNDLNLNDTGITDAGVPHLGQMESLTSVSLCNSSISDAGLAELHVIESLTHLLIEGTQVGDPGIAHLRELPQLEYLGLSGTYFTPEGLRELRAALPRCDVRY
jgi:Tfp pilus assembly protein PilN